MSLSILAAKFVPVQINRVVTARALKGITAEQVVVSPVNHGEVEPFARITARILLDRKRAAAVRAVYRQRSFLSFHYSLFFYLDAQTLLKSRRGRLGSTLLLPRLQQEYGYRVGRVDSEASMSALKPVLYRS